MSVTSKVSESNNFKTCNYLKLSFTNTCCLYSNYVGCESFLQSDASDILALWAKIQKLKRFNQYLFEGFYPLNWKVYVTHVHGLAVYLEEFFFLHKALTLKTLIIPINVFDWLNLIQCLISFISVNHCPLFCAQFFKVLSLSSLMLIICIWRF